MSRIEELDRQIAEQVFGEPEPGGPPAEYMDRSIKGEWRAVPALEEEEGNYVWRPLSYTREPHHAMRAVDEVFKEYPGAGVTVKIFFDGDASTKVVASHHGVAVFGAGIEEAMMRLLLELKDRGMP